MSTIVIESMELELIKAGERLLQLMAWLNVVFE